MWETQHGYYQIFQNCDQLKAFVRLVSLTSDAFNEERDCLMHRKIPVCVSTAESLHAAEYTRFVKSAFTDVVYLREKQG